MWIIYSLLFALFLSFRNILSRKNSNSENSELLSTWYIMTFAIPVALIYFLITGDFQINENSFWIYTFIRITIDFAAIFFYFKALKLEEVSYVVPLLSIQPVLTILTAYLINNQKVELIAFAGIILISFANFLLFYSEKKGERLKNTSNFLKATISILITVVCYSFIEPLHAEAISKSNEQTYFLVSQIIFSLAASIILFLFDRKSIRKSIESRSNLLLNILMGIVLGLEIMFLYLALGTKDSVTALVIAIGSTNIVISSFMAYFILKEKINRLKIFSIFLITIGAIIVSL